MATLYYLTGFSASGSTQSMTIKSGAGTGTVAAATYAHVSFASILTSQYTLFATAVNAALVSAAAGTYTVSWSATTGLYTIYRGTAFTLSFPATAAGARCKAALGFTSDTPSGAGTVGSPYVSDCRPLYYAVPLMVGRSAFSDVYEPDDIAEEAVSDGGTPYAVSRQTSELLCDWTQSMEAKGYPSGSLTTGGLATLGCATFTLSASATFPWSWQAMVKHVRGQHPIGVYESATANTLHKLRADGASFVPERVESDYDGLWNIPFRTRHLGVLP